MLCLLKLAAIFYTHCFPDKNCRRKKYFAEISKRESWIFLSSKNKALQFPRKMTFYRSFHFILWQNRSNNIKIKSNYILLNFKNWNTGTCISINCFHFRGVLWGLFNFGMITFYTLTFHHKMKNLAFLSPHAPQKRKQIKPLYLWLFILCL